MMKEMQSITRNEKGSIILICMIILVLLTLFGMSAITTTSIETQIAGNERRHKKIFYAAESGWQAAVKWIDNQFPLSSEDTGLDTSSGVTFSSGKFGNPDALVLDSNSSVSTKIEFVDATPAPGYSAGFYRYTYRVTATATGSLNTKSEIVIGAAKTEDTGL